MEEKERKELLQTLKELQNIVNLYCFFADNSENEAIMKHYNEFRKQYDKKLEIVLNKIN